MSKLLYALLVVAGTFAIVMGVGVVIFSLGPLRTTVKDATEDLGQALSGLGKELGVLSDAVAQTKPLLDTTQELLTLVPDTLLTVQGSLLQAANTLSSTAVTVQSVKTGTGLVGKLALPDLVFTRSAGELERLSAQLSLTAAMTGKIQRLSGALSGQSSTLLETLSKSKLDVPREALTARTDRARALLASPWLPWLVAGGGVAFGLLLSWLGLLSLGLAAIGHPRRRTQQLALAPVDRRHRAA